MVVVLSWTCVPSSAAQDVEWEQLPLIPNSPATTAYGVAFFGDQETDVVWVSRNGPLRYAPEGSGTQWGDWNQLCSSCGGACNPTGGIITSSGTLLTVDPFNVDRLPLNGTWECNVGERGDPLFQTSLPGLQGVDGNGLVLSGGLGTYISDDDGRKDTWDEGGLPGGDAMTYDEVPVSDSLPNGRLLAGVLGGITISDDGGQTWNGAQGGYPGRIGFSFAFLPEPEHPYGGTLYAGMQDFALVEDSSATVYRSEDGGATWTLHYRFSPSALGLAGAAWVQIEATPDGVLWAGVSPLHGGSSPGSGAIARSEDGGETWELAQTGFDGWRIRSLDLGPNGRLYASTDVGLWRTVEPVFVAATDVPDEEPLELVVQPNPSRQLVTLELMGLQPERYQLVVVDSVGREVTRTELASGSSWRLDVSSWAPGVYHVRVGEGHAVEAASFTVVR